MSVLIKGMEIPTSCEKCPFEREILSRYVCAISGKVRNWGLETRLSDCPLVHVPPHGRGIDADALKVSLAFAEATAKWAVPALRAVLMVIDEMPTIIPAEEGE